MTAPPPRRLWLVWLLALLATSGCERRVLWTVRDDPYLQDMAALQEPDVLAMLRSMYRDDRQLALRTLAIRSAEARERGDDLSAERLVQMLLQQYRKDRRPETRGTIVSLCAPICGVGSERMHAFLRERIADGEWTVEAALSLAAIDGEDAAATLVPLTRHPAPEARYGAAFALTGVGGSTARSAVRTVLDDMSAGNWPQEVAGLPLATARERLAARAERMLGMHASAPPTIRLPEVPDTPALPSFDALPEMP